MTNETMRAQIVPHYGNPDVFQLAEVAKPVTGPGQVRVKIGVVTAGPADCALRAGKPFLVRLLFGLKRPKFPILGAEIAGIVDEIGQGVTKFKKGDVVFVHSPDVMGGYAEYLCLDERAHIVHIPSSIGWEDAVSICDGGSTALVFLRDGAKLQKGQRILIYGASGSVGLASIQVAKHFGAHVTAVSSAKNHELVKSHGADETIDYTIEDFRENGKTYDVVLDAVGKLKYSKCRASLTPTGIYLTTAPDIGLMIRSSFFSNPNKKRGKFIAAGLQQTVEDLNLLFELAKEGKVKPVVDRVYEFERLGQAHDYVETGRKTGSVVIRVAALPTV